MTAVALLCALLTGWLAVGPSPGRALDRLSPRAAAPFRGRVKGRLGAVGILASATALALALVIDGTRGAALALSAACLVGTSAAVVLRRRRTKRALDRMTEVARAGEVLASLVRVGHVPSAALVLASVDCPVLESAAAVQTVGGEPVATLRSCGRSPGGEGLVAIAEAWQVSSVTGAPMVTTLDAVTDHLRAAKDLARVVDSELAASRATGQLLAGLPFAGLGMGVALGGDPVGFLTGSPAGQLCLVAGVGLACLGVLWSEELTERAADRHHGQSGRRRRSPTTAVGTGESS